MATSKKTPAAAGPQNKGLKVISKREGFRRGGRAWSEEAKVVALSELTPEQADAIRDESMLIVSEVDIEPAEKA